MSGLKDKQFVFIIGMVRSDSGITDTFAIDTVGRQKIKCTIPANFFNSGTFYTSFQFVENKNKLIMSEDAIINLVLHLLGSWMGQMPVFFKPKFQWSNESVI